MRGRDPLTRDEMTARYDELLNLRDEIDAKLHALANGLRMYGRRGAPRKAAAMSSADACRAHAAYQSGDDSQWASEGERQYKRESKRHQRRLRSEVSD